MNNDPLLLLEATLAVAVPTTLLAAGVAAPRRAAIASLGALVLATLLAVVAALTPASAANPVGARVDAVSCVALLLLGGLGTVIVRFSVTYLRDEPGLAAYLRWLLLTLAAVSTLALANDLRLLAVAWTATSLSLLPLLTFYRDRPIARVAAQKQFVVNRLADLCLLVSLTLLYLDVGGFHLDELARWAQANPELSVRSHAAAVLVVAAVALRSAQLPFHGWLIQVMEAPTPVSALLHAGVVNLAGLVLIRLAPWMAHAHLAQLLLVAVGLGTAVVASLVATTRVSVKVALAWSTCAQMGFMLLQCGLGLWHLALLHLVAHSLYKAHAFLSAGDTVEASQRRPAQPAPPGTARHPLTAALACALTAALVAVIGFGLGAAGTTVGLAALITLAMVPFAGPDAGDARTVAQLIVQVATLVVCYALAHFAASWLLEPPATSASPVAYALVLFGFLALFVVKTALLHNPRGRLARALYPALFAGLDLDERFHRKFTITRVYQPVP